MVWPFHKVQEFRRIGWRSIPGKEIGKIKLGRVAAQKFIRMKKDVVSQKTNNFKEQIQNTSN